MVVESFVQETLKVPITLVGYTYICKSIQEILDNKDPRFYAKVSQELETSKSVLEKNIRTARIHSLKSMSLQNILRIFGGKGCRVTNVEYICYSAEYYRKEFMNEEQES